MSWFGLFGPRKREQPRGAHVFNDEDRDLSRARQRMKAKELEMEQERKELKWQLEKEELLARLEDLRGDDDEDDNNPANMMLLSLLNGGGVGAPSGPADTVAVSSAQVQKRLTDEEIMGVIDQFDRKHITMAAKLPEDILLYQLRQRMPGYSEDTYTRAVGLLKDRK